MACWNLRGRAWGLRRVPSDLIRRSGFTVSAGELPTHRLRHPRVPGERSVAIFVAQPLALVSTVPHPRCVGKRVGCRSYVAGTDTRKPLELQGNPDPPQVVQDTYEVAHDCSSSRIARCFCSAVRGGKAARASSMAEFRSSAVNALRAAAISTAGALARLSTPRRDLALATVDFDMGRRPLGAGGRVPRGLLQPSASGGLPGQRHTGGASFSHTAAGSSAVR